MQRKKMGIKCLIHISERSKRIYRGIVKNNGENFVQLCPCYYSDSLELHFHGVSSRRWSSWIINRIIISGKKFYKIQMRSNSFKKYDNCKI